MEWLWTNFKIVSQKSPLYFKLVKASKFPTLTNLNLNSLSLSIPAKALLVSQYNFILKNSNNPSNPSIEAFSDVTLQNIARTLLEKEWIEDAYEKSVEGYPVESSGFSTAKQVSSSPLGGREHVLWTELSALPWSEFLQRGVQEDFAAELRTRKGLVEYIRDSYSYFGTEERSIDLLLNGVFSLENWTYLSQEDLVKFHDGWNLDLPLNLTHVGVISLQNAIIEELMTSALYNSEKLMDYFRGIYDPNSDIIAYWKGSIKPLTIS